MTIIATGSAQCFTRTLASFTALTTALPVERTGGVVTSAEIALAIDTREFVLDPIIDAAVEWTVTGSADPGTALFVFRIAVQRVLTRIRGTQHRRRRLAPSVLADQGPLWPLPRATITMLAARLPPTAAAATAVDPARLLAAIPGAAVTMPPAAVGDRATIAAGPL